MFGWVRRRKRAPDPPPVLSRDLAELLDRVLFEEQRVSWETLQHLATTHGVPLGLVVSRAWGLRFPRAELVAAGLPEREVDHWDWPDWWNTSPQMQAGLLKDAFAFAAHWRQHEQWIQAQRR